MKSARSTFGGYVPNVDLVQVWGLGLVKKACVGEGGELERALDDANGTDSTVPCCEKQFEKKLQKTHSPTVVKVFENKFSQVVQKSFEFVLCLFGFWAAHTQTFSQDSKSGRQECIIGPLK